MEWTQALRLYTAQIYHCREREGGREGEREGVREIELLECRVQHVVGQGLRKLHISHVLISPFQ